MEGEGSADAIIEAKGLKASHRHPAPSETMIPTILDANTAPSRAIIVQADKDKQKKMIASLLETSHEKRHKAS